MNSRPLLAACTLALSVAGSVAAQTAEPDFAAGAEEYRVACAACHGEAAGGNGPIATMFQGGVPDLTGLAARNDGIFPLTDVVQMIDGRLEVRAHGNPMPVFGNRYAAASGPDGENMVRLKVLELTYYLNSIQE